MLIAYGDDLPRRVTVSYLDIAEDYHSDSFLVWLRYNHGPIIYTRP